MTSSSARVRRRSRPGYRGRPSASTTEHAASTSAWVRRYCRRRRCAPERWKRRRPCSRAQLRWTGISTKEAARSTRSPWKRNRADSLLREGPQRNRAENDRAARDRPRTGTFSRAEHHPEGIAYRLEHRDQARLGSRDAARAAGEQPVRNAEL